MKPFILPILTVLCLNGQLLSSQEISCFSYDEFFVPVGSALEYALGDQTGYVRNVITYFYSAPDEYMTKAKILTEDAVYFQETFKIDWNRMMISLYEMTNTPRDGKYSDNTAMSCTIQDNPDKNKVVMEFKIWKKDTGPEYMRNVIDYRIVPSFFGNNWALEVIFLFRYLNLEPKESVSFGTYSTAGFTEFIIKRSREETVNGRACLRYDFQPAGLLGMIFGPKGRVWRDKAEGTVVRYEFDMAMNKLKNLRMDLIGERTLTVDEWSVYTPTNP